ncbi:site-specific integrase [Bradyrhizobium sp. BRP56]|uniref:site-specific integrase n=1 Tax=Bradyrhizobium sp. BRP56 TaxID=2793819 RepID=UPI001CD6C0EE|nr:site-specific integrase [Bradyrhizobium sp. BRP56]MCA1399345.1 site-specific integrase [Bradyrhizobium sp. BRP56]
MTRRVVRKRSHGDGGIDQRGENTFRLRYRVNGKRFAKTFRGPLTEARKELRKLLKAKDDGLAVEPSKLTLAGWITLWIDSGAPGPKNKRKVGQRTLERYEQLLKEHVVPVLGATALQVLQASAIDKLYAGLDGKVIRDELAPRTARHVHTVFNACLGMAELKRLVAVNPMRFVGQIPNPNPGKPEAVDLEADDVDGADEVDEHDEGLSEAELKTLVTGFKPSSLYPIIVLAAATGARRNEVLALRWSDLDADKKTLRIERAWEHTKKFGLRLKPPKTERGRRSIDLDEATIAVLLAEKDRLQRIVAGVPDGVDVDLSLVKLPARALMFPALPEPGNGCVLTAPRVPRNVSKEFRRRADLLKFKGIKLHTLRGVHATALLDAGIGVHIVAKRIGDDPATLLRWYAKRKRTQAADTAVSAALTSLAAGFLGK